MTTAAAPTETTTVHSHLLGACEVPASACFAFAEGPYGFPAARRWALLPTERPGLWWLQSRETPALAFAVADPFVCFPGYAPDIPDAEVAELRDAPYSAEVPLVFVVVTLPDAPGRPASANLRAPVLLAPTTGRGRQVVLADDACDVRAPLALD